MQVNSTSYQPNFEAKVSKRFVDAAQEFCQKDDTGARTMRFHKKLSDVDGFGHPASEIKFSKNRKKGSYKLILRNEKLAPGEFLVLCNKDRFRKVVEYFSHLTDGKLKFAEKRLTGEIK